MIGRNEFNRLEDEVDDKAGYYPDGYQPPPVIWQPEGGLSAYYFSAEAKDDTNVTISNIRFRYGKNTGTSADTDVAIPTVDGTYYVHFQATFATSYTFTIEPGTINTHPTQNDVDATTRAWREEICAVVVADNVVSSVTQIWPGSIMSIEGRIV